MNPLLAMMCARYVYPAGNTRTLTQIFDRSGFVFRCGCGTVTEGLISEWRRLVKQIA